jgi:hypothetical protein
MRLTTATKPKGKKQSKKVNQKRKAKRDTHVIAISATRHSQQITTELKIKQDR